MTFTVLGPPACKGSTVSDTESDMSRVLDYLRGLLRDYDSQQIVSFVHEGAPASKARARWNRIQQRFYTPASSSGPQQALSWAFKAAVKGEPWRGNIALVAIFFRPNHQRIDGDNLMKLVLDAGTKAGVWGDDCQVTHQVSVIEKDALRPRTVIAMSPVGSSLDRNQTVELSCVRCGKSFTRMRTAIAGRTPKYCSPACVATPLTSARPAEFQRPAATCSKCGNRVSRREYLFCALCRRKGRKPGAKNKPKTEPIV